MGTMREKFLRGSLIWFVSAAVYVSGAEMNEQDLPARESFHLFLLAGQSNMAGRGEVEPQDQEPHPNILALNKEQRWQHAVDPIHFDKPIAGVGLARSFALEYLKDHPGVTVGFIPAACGGSPISVWRPGQYFDVTRSHPYDDAIERSRTALKHGTLKGILWHQGENDCHEGLSELYEQSLGDLVARFRKDLQAANVPFVLGQMGRFEGKEWTKHTVRVDAATKAVASRDSLVGFVSSEGLTSKADLIHFNTASLRELGRRYYAAFKEILNH